VKGFGCRPHEGRHREFGGRRPKASKGGNRAQGNGRRCRGRYGDLRAASEVSDWDLAAPRKLADGEAAGEWAADRVGDDEPSDDLRRRLADRLPIPSHGSLANELEFGFALRAD
jgi:hypothetical protein